MSIHNYEQARAKQAWDDIENIDRIEKYQNSDGKTRDDKAEIKFKKEYGSLARGMPAMIQMNGLGQSLAYLLAKSKGYNDKYYIFLYRHIALWLKNTIHELKNEEDLKIILPILVELPSKKFMYATREAIAFSIWLRRFAEAKGWAEDEIPTDQDIEG